ncbi:MAG TPA: DUF3560 domain-containing protein [Ktedonobacteraceae bacterium]|nr:DUF3560 domain-containing protein [Ktedonobacteraceae bacterium]
MAERKGRKPAGAQQIELWQTVPLPQAQTRRRPDTPSATAIPQVAPATASLPANRTEEGATAQTEFIAAHQQATAAASQALTEKGKPVKLENFEHYEQSLQREEARLQDLEERGAEALSEYDIKIAVGGDAELALRTALMLVHNHIAYDRSHMEQVRPAAQQTTLTIQEAHAEEVIAPASPDPHLNLESLRPLVTVVKLWQLTERQKVELVIPTPLCILASKDREKRIQYKAGMITERNPVTAKQQALVAFGEKTQDIEEAYQMIEEGVRQRKLDREGLQPIVVPAKPEPQPEPAPTSEQVQQNPLLALLKEDEIYVDPNEVTIEEAEENGYPLLRRDIVTYRWWLEFPFDTREQPELNAALKESQWRWGGYRQQWHTASHFPDMPKDMQYANAGPAFYSEENAERIEARATKARDKSSAHLERSNQLASIIPFGQPMMPNHYSYRSDLSYRKKIWRQMDLFVDFYKKAEWLENRADGSRRLQNRGKRLSSMQNRVDTLSALLRKVRREYEEAKGLNASYLDYYRKRLTILAQEIIPLQAAIAERGGLPIDQVQQSERPLQPRDYIQVRGRGVYVKKVNKKTIICLDPSVHYANGEMWESKYGMQEFQRLLATKEQVDAIKAKGAQEGQQQPYITPEKREQ